MVVKLRPLLAAAALLVLSGVQSAGAQSLVLSGGTLIDGTGKPPLANAVVVMEGGRFKAVGVKGQVAIPAGARVIDVTGRTILPGLIDSHTHTQEWQIPMFLPYGVTTIADQNNDAPWIMAQREAVAKGRINGPRILVAGSAIHGPIFPQPWPSSFNTPVVTSPEEARAMVRRKKAEGSDFIWVNFNLTDDELAAAVDEANKLGMATTGHAQNMLRGAQAGLKHAEHLWTVANALVDPDEKISPYFPRPPGWITPEALVSPKNFPPLVGYLVAQGVFMNPTLVLTWAPSTPREAERVAAAKKIFSDPQMAFVPANAREAFTRVGTSLPNPGWDNTKEFLRQYAKAGGKAVVGTDAGFSFRSIPGLVVHEEMQMLVDTGYSPMQAIQAATLWNAEFLKKEKEFGSVEAGKLADILVIEGNPLADIAATQNVRMVIKDGKVMDTKYDPRWVNPIAQPFSTYQLRAPAITDFSPRMARQGGKTVTLEITGTGFLPGMIVRFGNADLPTRFVSPTKLTATLDARFLQRKPGSYVFYAVDSGPHGTVSEPGFFLINLKE